MNTIFTFYDAEIAGIEYQLDDTDITNDILAIVGESGSEQLVRGVDSGSVAKYGRRSTRLNTPIGFDSNTVQALIETMLDRNIEPYPKISMSIIGKTDQLITAILGILISDKVTVTVTSMGLSADFIIESVNLDVTINGILCVTYDAVQARANE
jgi:hypothetical protein